MERKKVDVGGVVLGGGKVAVQSMTTVKTSDVEECVAQIIRLEEAGCDIARVAVLDEADAHSIRAIKNGVHIPVVADIHFSPRLAVLAVEAGADKLRINPGNIGGQKGIAQVADCVKAHGIPVRVGANTGSIEPNYLRTYGRSAEALVLSALDNVHILESLGIDDIVISVKASDVPLTVKAYRMLSERTEYPLHLGVTEAGVGESALIKSGIGIGSLLLEGIGDTIRVSLSDDPVQEVHAAHEILRACGLEKDYVEVVACPTCGRCEYDCMGLAKRVHARVRGVKKSCKVAVMGCIVNGPGEAKDADLGIAGGREYCVIFQREKMFRVFFEFLEELLK